MVRLIITKYPVFAKNKILKYMKYDFFIAYSH
jgi:hypothetical protein